MSTTIHLSRPERNDGQWVVFGSHDDGDDRFVFAVQRFAAGDRRRAEATARQLKWAHKADRIERD